jgi:hypothetical protein
LLGEEALPPGGEGTVEVSIATAGRAGKLTKGATVETDDPAHASTVLTVSANVIVDLDFERNFVRFPTTRMGEQTSQAMPILAVNPEALAFGKVTSTVDGVTGNVLREEADGKPVWSLQLYFKPKTIGSIAGQVDVKVLKPEEKTLSLNVTGVVEGDIKALPTFVSLRKLENGTAPEGKVTLKSEKGPFKIRKIAEEQGYVKVTTKTVTAGKEYALTVGVTALGMTQERFSTKVVITTDSHAQPSIDLPVSFFGGKLPVVQGTKPGKGPPQNIKVLKPAKPVLSP